MEKEISDAIDRLKNDPNIASHVKDLLLYLYRSKEQMDYLVARNRQFEEELLTLRQENMKLKKQCSSSEAAVKKLQPSQPQPQVAEMISNTSVDPNDSCEVERRRSLILKGVPEQMSMTLSRRLSYDFMTAVNVLLFLNIECSPTAVYRLGRPKPGYNRLLKIVLPSSSLQSLALQRAHRLRSYPGKGLFLRESLTYEERKRRKECQVHGGVRDGGTIYPPAPVSRDRSGNADISVTNQPSSTNPTVPAHLYSERDTLN